MESKALDPADVFGSDDEGFLEDSDEQNAAAEASLQQSALGMHPNGHVTGFDNLSGAARQTAHPESSSSRYLPANLPATKSQPSTSYAPLAPQFTDLSRPVTAGAFPAPYAAPPLATFPGQQLQPQRPELPKAESFADKNKGGYSSPYDLPMDVVKPRKRASMQHMNRGHNQFASPPPVSPPRSASVHAQPPPPSRGSISSQSPPTTSYSAQPSTLQPAGISTGQAPQPSLKSKVSSSNFLKTYPCLLNRSLLPDIRRLPDRRARMHKLVYLLHLPELAMPLHHLLEQAMFYLRTNRHRQLLIRPRDWWPLSVLARMHLCPRIMRLCQLSHRVIHLPHHSRTLRLAILPSLNPGILLHFQLRDKEGQHTPRLLPRLHPNPFFLTYHGHQAPSPTSSVVQTLDLLALILRRLVSTGVAARHMSRASNHTICHPPGKWMKSRKSIMREIMGIFRISLGSNTLRTLLLPFRPCLKRHPHLTAMHRK